MLRNKSASGRFQEVVELDRCELPEPEFLHPLVKLGEVAALSIVVRDGGRRLPLEAEGEGAAAGFARYPLDLVVLGRGWVGVPGCESHRTRMYNIQVGQRR